jgi:hypothetical protein
VPRSFEAPYRIWLSQVDDVELRDEFVELPVLLGAS